ncbi:MAG TPA: M14 family zinc carboxypeptidase [Bacteroidales bacterium]|jgi:hypothetical protein|nr:M14 family zinc carboxypeptidase [Bacteroidales bacterium]HQJ83283.1 M14 family zinc carboxypeptidase [Bacteroidales bacterium]
MRIITALIPALLMSQVILSQPATSWYFPDDVTFNGKIITPEQFAGHQIGEWHLSHDKLYYYMQELARSSDRALWEEYARSHEGRPLGHLIISSPENIRNLERLRLQHISLADPEKSSGTDISNAPVFIKLGYGIHGNESSSQNASVLVAYYLTAGEGPSIDKLLRNIVVLIDPALNPDGMQRHSTWVNFSRSLNDNPDPRSWEFSENWPGGRSNHYMFDLNRDYLLLQHPESVGRVAAFYRWRPDIVTDHHEQGPNATFFYQPGIPTRNNPLTPSENQQLTAEIGKFHEKFLNRIGTLYVTEESYDDFYIGKGSSYPDIHGSVGILFEQAGVKGHLRETSNMLLSFPYTIRNQVAVSLSTLEAGLAMREKLLNSLAGFYREAAALADKHPVKAYIFTEPDDKGRLSEFIRILKSHQIKVYGLSRDAVINGISYSAGASYIVPLKQNEHRFVRSLFEPVKEFTDSTFYDISTWILPMSFNIRYAAITQTREAEALRGKEIREVPLAEGKLLGPEDPFAYLFEWKEYLAPAALFELQNAGIRTRVAKAGFAYRNSELNHAFGCGTIMIHANDQPVSRTELKKIILSAAEKFRLTVHGVSTGFTEEGIDLGSSDFVVLEKPSVALIAGDGINSLDAGEIWHMLDTRFRMPVTMIRPAAFDNADLNRYNVLVIAGSPALGPRGIEKIMSWNRQGGTIIGYKGGNNWLAANKLAEIEYIPPAESVLKEGIYAHRAMNNQVRQIPGSIFSVKLDLTHPLCYGYTGDIVPVMKTGTAAVKKVGDIYANPAVYTSDPLLSGYCTRENTERLKGSSFVSVHRGRIISIYDNTNFRAIWYGTNKIFLNAVFFGQLL